MEHIKRVVGWIARFIRSHPIGTVGVTVISFLAIYILPLIGTIQDASTLGGAISDAIVWSWNNLVWLARTPLFPLVCVWLLVVCYWDNIIAWWRKVRPAPFTVQPLPGEGGIYKDRVVARLSIGSSTYRRKCSVRLLRAIPVTGDGVLLVSSSWLHNKYDPAYLEWAQTESSAAGDHRQFIDIPSNTQRTLHVAIVDYSEEEPKLRLACPAFDRRPIQPNWSKLILEITSEDKETNCSQRVELVIHWNPEPRRKPQTDDPNNNDALSIMDQLLLNDITLDHWSPRGDYMLEIIKNEHREKRERAKAAKDIKTADNAPPDS